MNGNDCDGNGGRAEDPNTNMHENKQPDGGAPTLGQRNSELEDDDGAGAEDDAIDLTSSDSDDEVEYLGEVKGVVEVGVDEEVGKMLNEVPDDEEEVENEVEYLGEVQGTTEADVGDEGGVRRYEVPDEEEEAMVVDISDDEEDDPVNSNPDNNVADNTWSSVEWEGHQCICCCRPGPTCSCETCENCDFFTLKEGHEGGHNM